MRRSIVASISSDVSACSCPPWITQRILPSRSASDLLQSAVRSAYDARSAESVDQVIREAFLTGPGSDEGMACNLREVDEIMTMLESHAHFVELEIKRLYLPHGLVESHFDMLSLIFHYAGQRKIAQYVDGIPAVTDAVRSGTLEALFKSLE